MGDGPDVGSREHLSDTIRPHQTLDHPTMRQQNIAVASGRGSRSLGSAQADRCAWRPVPDVRDRHGTALRLRA